jgi:hypothetical protein
MHIVLTYSVPTGVCQISQRSILQRLATYAIFHISLFDLDGTLTDPKGGHYRIDPVCAGRGWNGRIPSTPPSTGALARRCKKPSPPCCKPTIRSYPSEALHLFRERFGTVGLFENITLPGHRPRFCRRCRPPGCACTLPPPNRPCTPVKLWTISIWHDTFWWCMAVS